ncbi:DegT/DnrJ/EryC1/StrS family aminotransferase [candidate division KSB1 bacterium]|nr:DegT/DnrJ/EryC1/StrS family aminotransferase [candidate division KSB1 bacterium]
MNNIKKRRDVPFNDIKRRYTSIKGEIDTAIQRVLSKGWFILGSEVKEFEAAFAEYLGAKYAVAVGSGTEALHLALIACDLKPGDEVITVPNTAIPTISAISFAQLKPVFVDIDPDTYCMNVELIEEKINQRTRAIIPVHLYGNACDMEDLMSIAKKYGLQVIEDACQAHGAYYKGKRLGTFGHFGCFSFYPTKNLGAFGDGGMVVTNDVKNANKINLLRNYGQVKRYYHEIKGFNSRLDEIQAAILNVQLPYLDTWNKRRREIASLYRKLIYHPQIVLPPEQADVYQIYHLFIIRCVKRDRLRTFLSNNGIGTEIHYPVPCHLQNAYKDLGYSISNYPITEGIVAEILSLPMYPELIEEEIQYVADVMNRFDLDDPITL